MSYMIGDVVKMKKSILAAARIGGLACRNGFGIKCCGCEEKDDSRARFEKSVKSL